MPGKPSDTDILNRTRVLAIDDEPLVLETYRKLYQGRVETAATAAAGLALLRKDEDLRIVILDLAMRDGGLPFLTTMHRRFPERITIVLAANATPFDPVQTRDLGIFRCLEKTSANFAVLEDAIKDGISLLRVRARTP